MSESQSTTRNLRRAKACNTCRRKKVKCDGKRPACSPCHAFNLPCAYQDVAERRNRGSRAYIEELEQRIERMQAQLESLSKPGNEQRNAETPRESTSPSVEDRELEHPAQGIHPSETGQMLSEDGIHPTSDCHEKDQSFIINAQDGRTRYFGASSAFSALSDATVSGPENQTEMAARRRAPQRNSSAWPLTSWVPSILQDGPERRSFEPLPHKHVTMQVLGEYFATFNQAIPLFDEASFMRAVNRQYSWNPDDSASWWISLNIVLAMSYRERTHASPDGSDNWKRSLGHVKNALNAVTDVFLRNTDLSAVQGLLGLALYFQGTPNPQALFMFAAAAMRLAQSIGLHRSPAHGTSFEDEQRRRTFWIAFFLDSDISIRVGRPPIQDIEDYDTSLPMEDPPDGKGILSIDGIRINFFRLLVQLALAQRHVYRHLYTVTIRRQTSEKVIEEVKSCAKLLLRWKNSVPPRLQPQREFVCQPSYFLQHIVRLHFAYHCCYSNLYQVCMFQANATQRPSNGRDEDISLIVSRSLDSARSALALLSHINLLGSTYKWNVIYFPAAASVPLALRLLTNPTHSFAGVDFAMIRDIVNFLANTASEEPGTYVDYILGMCSDLERSARQAIMTAQQGPRPMVGANKENSAPDGIREGTSRPAGYPIYNTLSTSSSSAPMLDEGSAHTMNILPQAPYPDIEFPTLAAEYDVTPNWQWSLPPFWNWQDIVPGVPSFPVVPGGDTPEVNVPDV
ncbi:hypothetical protein BO94DRAFT_300728 [Aspergillus sclerotioniger CBS 115572]|uniref:Zn(2)-C6 fungal-type domain-containing protein n=1 Tax=Aspergillus sclerotioniger CBS 115572 TaxID=1450535 RepID=A0A317V4C7_9EURO|nr:hypothetical protein BO94DRAFT_300728 [Aspergillus sclerotioniger CBS 115572]PWY68499.1 hypothetical protein BO94DRAFT_300728 [Aspergillus sclerotioniger CBS 115572]